MNRSLNKIFEVYVVAYAFFFASKPLSDPDFWFHLKTGEYIIRTSLIPRTELFSFTNYGKPWIAHGWLSGAIFYAIYSRLGFDFLIFLFAVLAALAFWIVFRRCNSHPFIAGFATLLGVWTALPTIGVRPRVFTLLLASVYLALLTHYARRGRGRAIWWLVPLMGLWANLHGGFLIGLALIGLTIIGIPLDAWAAGEKIGPLWPRLRALWLVLFGCSLVALLNPYGVRIYTFPIRVLLSPIYNQVIVDWVSPDFHELNSLPLLLLILLTITAFALSPERVKPSDLLLFLATLYATLKQQRNMAIFALVAAPLLAGYFQNWLVSTSFGKPFGRPSSSESSRRPILLSLLLLLPLAAFAAKLKSTIYAPPTQERIKVPVKAVGYLKEMQITGNTFTDPNIWGGYLIWALPSNPVYIDGRDVYPQEFLKEYVDIIQGVSDWRAPFDRYGVRIVIIEPRSMLARELLGSPEWQQVYQDEMAVVFHRR
jgi:hypothetical protein